MSSAKEFSFVLYEDGFDRSALLSATPEDPVRLSVVMVSVNKSPEDVRFFGRRELAVYAVSPMDLQPIRLLGILCLESKLHRCEVALQELREDGGWGSVQILPIR